MLKARRYALAAALVAGTFAAWLFWARPTLVGLPVDFQYQADIFSRDNFYDPKVSRFTGEILSLTRFEYEATERRAGSALLVKNLFDVSKSSGERIFSAERLYGVDRRTWKHLSGLGDRDRDGYLFAPRRTGKRPFTYWHINYDIPLRMIFQREEEIQGLRVHRYACDFKADQTKDLGHLPGVPESLGVELDVHFESWVEPASGWLVKYEDKATAWYYDVNSHKRLHPWNQFKNEFSEASVAEQVRLAKHARSRTQWAGSRGWTAWTLLVLALAVWAVLRRIPAPQKILRIRTTFRFKQSASSSAAWICTLLGLTVMIGHFLHIPRLLQVFPAFMPMQFNTALGFAMLGLGYSGALSGRKLLANGAAVLTATLGIVTLGQYLLGIDLGLDQVLMRASSTVQTSHPGRMAPMAALCFTLCGSALFLSSQKRWNSSMSFLGAMAAGLSGSSMLGYLLDFPLTYGLGPWSGMALHTATGFLLFGSGLVIEGWPDPEARTGARRVAFILGIGGISFLLILYSAIRSREELQIRNLVSGELDRAMGRAMDGLEERIRALSRMALRWKEAGGTPRDAWEADAAQYSRDFPGYQAISWVDSSSTVRWIVPLAGNRQVVGYSLEIEGIRQTALLDARRGRIVTMTRPLDLFQGGKGFLVCIPLFLKDESFDGYITGVFRFDGLMDVLIRENAAQGHAISLRVGETSVYRRGRELGPGIIVENETKIMGTAWNMALSPRPEWVNRARSSLPETVLACGMAILALGAVSLALGWKSARHAVILKRETNLALVAQSIAETAELKSAESLKEKESLLQEIHHRVKNNLQIVISLLRLQSERVRDEAVLNVLQNCQERVQSMATLHENLYRSGNLGQVDFREYLQELTADLAGTHSRGGIAIQTEVGIEVLDIQKAMPLGLLINELVTNAYKHAFPGKREGNIRVRLASEGGAGVLVVADDGVGMPDGDGPGRKGSLGMQIIETLSRQLMGKYEFRSNDGTEYHLRFPL